jgi:mono/diheme cytochrome c family protein
MRLSPSKALILGLAMVTAALFLWACAPGAAVPTPTQAPPKATPAAKEKPPTAAVEEEEVPAPYKGKKNPFTLNDKAAIEAGKAIYVQNCQSCHGKKGDGKGPAGIALKPPPPDFSSPEQLEHFERLQDHHFWRISEGVPGTAMPAWKGQLSEKQRWQVMTYEWSLGKK